MGRRRYLASRTLALADALAADVAALVGARLHADACTARVFTPRVDPLDREAGLFYIAARP